MPAETDSADAKELADLWWEASEEYRKDVHWLRAHASLAGGDKRLLLLGPGRGNALHPITLGLKEFLDRAGFSASVLDGDLDLAEHRSRAAGYPRIVALPITVGSCAEVLDFSAEPQLRKLLSVVLPREHRGGYFARVVDDRGLKIRECGSVGEEIDDSLGKKCLIALAGPLGRRESANEADTWTARAPARENAQAREAKREVGEEGSSASLTGLTKGVLGVGVLAIVALVVLALASVGLVGLILIPLVIAIMAFALRSEDKLSEGGLLEVVKEIGRQLSSIRSLGRKGGSQKQLPPGDGDESKPPTEEET